MPRQLRHSVIGCLDGTMQPTHPWKPGQQTLTSLRAAIQQLLDSVGKVLEDVALLVSADPLAGGDAVAFALGHEALGMPLGHEPQLDQCMVPDEALVQGTPHIKFDKKHEYLLVKVARRPKRLGGWLQERAHRVVLWAFFGPPPADMRRPCVMHVCHNRRCIQPEHLVWGEDTENRRRRASADVAARRRLRQQGRSSL